MGFETVAFWEIALALAVGILACAAGGAGSGLVMARTALGPQLAAVMGVLFGLAGGSIALVSGLVLILVLR